MAKAKVKSFIGDMMNTKAYQGASSVVDTLKDTRDVTFKNNSGTKPTSLVNKMASKHKAKIEAGDTRVLGGMVERQNPSVGNLYTGMKITPGADKALGAVTLGAFAGAGMFKQTEAYDSLQKYQAARSNETNSVAPHSDMGMYDNGVTDAVGIGHSMVSSSNGKVYGSSRDYSLGATGDLTLGLHRSRRRG